MSEKNAKLEALEADFHGAASDVATWRSFLEHPGWVLYSKILDEQMKLRQGTINFAPLESFGKIFAQEFMKGEASFAALALALPHTQLEQAQLTAKNLETAIELEKTNETEAPAGKRSRVDDEQFSRDE